MPVSNTAFLPVGPLGSLGLGTRNERDLDKRCSTSWGSLVLGRDVMNELPLRLVGMESEMENCRRKVMRVRPCNCVTRQLRVLDTRDLLRH